MPHIFLLIPRVFVLLTLFLFLLVVGARGSTGCLSVKEKWVTAADLVPIIPEFSKIEGYSKIQMAPSGTSRRWIAAAEIGVLANRLGVGPLTNPGELCIEQTKVELHRDQILQQLEAQLSLNGSQGELQIELINFFPKQLPPGVLRFEYSGLAPSCISGGCGLYRWIGAMLLEAGGSIPVTAEVRIESIGKSPIAQRDLPLGAKIGFQDFSMVESRHPWFPADARLELDLSGYIVQRPVKAGVVISRRSVRKPQEVEKGEVVVLHVKSGQLELVTQAKAETSGNAGDRVVVSNLVSRRRFMVEVTGPGHARTLSQGDSQ